MELVMERGARTGANDTMTPAEWDTRCDLAAAYRLVAHFGWDDMIATHLSARVRGTDDQFLINPVGFMFDEITASSLVKVDLAGNILSDTPHAINGAGFVIHSAVHAARHDVECVIHLHTLDGVAVSATEDGLLPLNQNAMLIRGQLARHAFEGIATDEAERARIAADLGDRKAMLLDNHGTLAVGASIAEAFYHIYLLERACSTQVRTLSMNLALRRADLDVTHATEHTLTASEAQFATISRDLLWPAVIRKLNRENPGFDQ